MTEQRKKKDLNKADETYMKICVIYYLSIDNMKRWSTGVMQ